MWNTIGCLKQYNFKLAKYNIMPENAIFIEMLRNRIILLYNQIFTAQNIYSTNWQSFPWQVLENTVLEE